MKFHCVTVNERLRFQPGIVALEQTATYPLGDDFFQIDHGADYFAFFDRLGEVYYYTALDGDFVSAVGAGVMRWIPYQAGGAVCPAWYLCDLKVHPKYQRQLLSFRLLRYALEANIQRCDRGYTISMNPGDGSPNRYVRTLEQFSPVKFRTRATLGIYSLDWIAMQKVEPLLIDYRGPVSYLSLQGLKDLRLQSTGQILPLLHVQWGATAQLGNPLPVQGHTHMFCVPSEDPLAIALAALEIHPKATASVVSHGMDNSDWRFILTSDI